MTPSDLSFILKQIKIAEAHVANTTSATGPCGALLGTGPNQLASPLLSYGLRTVDGSCNNLQAGQENFGAADQTFPRLGSKSFRDAEQGSVFGPPTPTSYAQKSGNVFDSQPRTISNLIVDQTSTNPAAVQAAGFPVRTQGNEGVVPCTTDPDNTVNPPVAGAPAGCVPSHETLFIPNVTTDVGLSPPYNSLFTLFGQFFDHGVDQTVKGGGTVFVPLKSDDPLVAGPDHVFGNADDLSPNLRFMVLTRGKNQPGPDGALGTADDIQDANNTDSPWVDQSQTYTSHSSHQVFVREYVNNSAGRPVSTGKLLGGPAGPTEGGMATWAGVKAQAATLLGLQLTDRDALDVPMIASDAYGKFIPGPARGLPQYVTETGLVEGNTAAPVAVPANVKHFDTPFLTDIANNAVPNPGFTADPDNVVTPGLVPCVQPGFPTGCVNQYDNEILDMHFAAGDGRVNENIGLTAIHQIFHSEHDRLVGDIKNVLTNDTSERGVAALAEWKLALGADGWNGERLFQAARFITEMEYQHLVFEEFARKIQPGINPFEPFAFTQSDINPAVKAEFAHAVYRFGHSMLTETIARTNEDGSSNDISLLNGFLNPPAYTDGGSAGPLTSEEAAGSIIMGMSDQAGNELDEFVTDTLRNKLLGLPLDLAAINITRARSEGIPTLNVLRRELFSSTNDGALTPYKSWVDFGENMKHPSSLINFVAAYGQHDSVKNATTLQAKRAAAKELVSPSALTPGGPVPPADAADFMNSTGAWANDGVNSKTGIDHIDLWMGGLAEMTTPFGGLLGSTFNYVFENQLTDLQNGDRFYYLARTPGMNLRAALEGNSFAEMMMRNTTNVHTLKADAFATADCKFQLGNLAGTPAGYATSGNTVANDPSSDCDEAALLIRQPDGTIQYRAFNSVDPSGINGQSVFNGTPGVDRVRAGNDNDTIWGGDGNDVIEGGSGADVPLGGEGNDIITDLIGDDVLKGGAGNDAMDGGPGLDILMGADGQDFMNGGANANETFAGEGDDFIIAGQGLDVVFGDGGNDWQEGGDQPDLLIGDSSNLFFLDDSQKPGHDILFGQGGDDDYDMEGGDDIGLAGPGVEKVAGASGYDWESGLHDPQPQDADLNLPILPLDILQVGVRDRYNEVESLSGGPLDDKLRGDDVVPSAVGGGGFIGCSVLDQEGVNRIAGLNELIPTLPTPLADVVAASASKDCPILSGTHVWGDGNILLGGGGSDTLEGRGANDIIDGDRYLNVRLSVRNAAGTEIGSAASMTAKYLRDGAGALTGPTLQEAVFAGTVDAGNIVAVRELLSTGGGTDSAVFSDVEANYTVTTTGGTGELGSPGSVTTVVHNGGGVDGTDTLRNIERLVFSDSVTPATPVLGALIAGNNQVTVNFTPAGGAAATAFQVRVVNAAGDQVGAIRTADAGTTSLVVNGLTNGTAYRFQIAAENAIGTSAFSALSSPVTPSAPVFAGAPAIGTATAGNAQATVRWTAPAAVTNATAVTQYRVRIFVGTAATATREVIVGNLTNTVVTGLINGTGYTFDVSAINSAGTGAPSARTPLITPRTEFVAPTITARTPAAGATSVSQTNNLTVTFSEPVANVGTGTVVLRLNGNATPIPAAVTYNNTTRTVTINPNATLLADRTYNLAFSSIRDTAGNSMAPSPSQFTTGPAPTVVSVSPGIGATGASRTANVTVRYSEPVTNVTTGTVVLRRGGLTGAVVTATVTYNATTRTATLNPSATLVANTTYTVATSSVRDLAGNPLAFRSWTFRTGAV
ncbi:peroxidase family protein [Arthrobacter sp. ZGTC131]|uniref:peroxidase family protein n=1 Tax=Arthrobacter sp. ZGTC131 TaxID=2058898 RepID=UPI00215727EC|nr:peroxidase family protein [Arthrobacter sp. ZGTC131]